MKAIVQTEYGSADVLKLVEVEQPVVSDQMPNALLVKVRATAVSAGDWHLMRGTPFLVRFIYGGVRRPQIKILGTDVAGEVMAIGRNVTQFKPGDQVFGELSECGFGAFAEYVCVPEKALVLKPSNLTFEEAAIVPVSALAALQGLRLGQIQLGQKVVVKGASGGVGSFAIQIAKAMGAEVTAVCSPGKVDRMQILGADRVIDNVANLKQQHYDLLLDAAAYRSVFDDLSTLKPKGIYVMAGGSMTRLFQVMLFGALMSKISGRNVKSLISKPNQADLLVLKDLIEAGKIYPCLDRTYPLSGVPDAIRAVEQRQVRGKVAIRI
jgi:2-desacetyl-2-hydroxyethyl bacteriochlorophyllide A dehydrogenase